MPPFWAMHPLKRQFAPPVLRQEAVQYSFSNITNISEKTNIVNFADGKCLCFVSAGEKVTKLLKELKENN